MSDNITITVNLAGSTSSAHTFDLGDSPITTIPPPPPMDDGDMNISVYTDEPAPPPEADVDMSSIDVQAKSTIAPPPDYNAEPETDAYVSDEETEVPLPPEA